MADRAEHLDKARQQLDEEATRFESPPIEAYDDEPRAQLKEVPGNSTPADTALIGASTNDSTADSGIRLQSALEIARMPESAVWLLKPYIEPLR